MAIDDHGSKDRYHDTKLLLKAQVIVVVFLALAVSGFAILDGYVKPSLLKVPHTFHTPQPPVFWDLKTPTNKLQYPKEQRVKLYKTLRAKATCTGVCGTGMPGHRECEDICLKRDHCPHANDSRF